MAFEKLKNAMVTLHVLELPGFNQPFEVETNASDHGIGAVLTQQRRLIAFYSHTLSLRSCAKLVYERELRSVVMVVQKCRPYLFE